jgi:CRP-like cAMP-binding protein
MTNESNIWFFEGVNLYKIFCPHNVKKNVGSKHEFVNYKKEEFVYFSDEPSKHVYLVVDGRIKIGSYSDSGKEIIKAILQKGEVFGELAIIGEESRREFAQAMEKVTICPLTIGDMDDLMKTNKNLSFKMTKLIGLRLKKAERRIESLVFKDARTRIMEFLIDSAEERGQKVGFEILVKDFLTHQDISNLTATSRQTVTTILNELRDGNHINFDRKRLLIRDLDKLKALLKK